MLITIRNFFPIASLVDVSGVFFMVFADYFHDLFGFFFRVNFLECDAMFPSLGFGVYFVYLEVSLDS